MTNEYIAKRRPKRPGTAAMLSWDMLDDNFDAQAVFEAVEVAFPDHKQGLKGARYYASIHKHAKLNGVL